MRLYMYIVIFKWYEGHWLEAQYVTMCKNVPSGRLTTTKKIDKYNIIVTKNKAA